MWRASKQSLTTKMTKRLSKKQSTEAKKWELVTTTARLISMSSTKSKRPARRENQ